MLQYLLKFSISLAVLFIFYRSFLRPLTFYQWNRFYLLCYSLLSFVIPFIDVSCLLSRSSNHNFVNIIPAVTYYNFANTAIPVAEVSWVQSLTTSDWLIIIFCAGAIVMLIKLFTQYLSLRSIRQKSVLLDENNDVQLYETTAAISPFSFGNAIYFNRQLHTEEELQRIIQHEFVHVKQKHTIDLLVGELLCVANWFNPFAWFIRYSIRQNLEFIADNNVVTNGLDKKEYQYLLLKVVGVPQYSIASNFNFSNLKKRIAMMNKMKSAKLHLTKFLFVLPLLVVLLLAFRNKISNDKKTFVFTGIVYDAKTAQPLAGVLINEQYSRLATATDANGFFKLKIPVGTDSIFKLNCNFLLPGYVIKENQNLSFSPAKVKTYADLVFAGMRQQNNSSYDGLTVSTHYQIPVTDENQFIADPDYSFVLDKFIAYQQSMNVPYGVPVLPPGSTIMLQNSMANSGDTTKEIFYYADSNYKNGTPNDTATFTYNNGTKAIYHLYNLSDPAVKALYKKRYGVEPYPRPVPAAQGVPVVQPSSVMNSKGFTITIANNNGEYVVLVKDNQQKIVKASTLVEWNKNKKQNENKYGEVPPLPPVKSAPAVPNADVQPPVVPLANNTAPFLQKPLPVVQIKDAADTTVHPLVVVDGVVKPDIEGVNRVDADEIISLNVLKDKAAIDKYGDKGKNGVVEITTLHPGAVTDNSKARNFDLYKLMAAETSGKHTMTEALLFIDGIEMPPGSNPEELMKPANISTIQVLQSAEATIKYGDKAKKGAIELLSKSFVGIALLVADGVAVPTGSKWDDYMYLKSNYKLKNVLRGKEATDKYGDKAKSGVIEMVTIKAIKATTSFSRPATTANAFRTWDDKKMTEVDNEINGKADTIYIEKQHLIIKGGSISIKGKYTKAEGELSFQHGFKEMPLVMYNGKEVEDLNAFKVAKASYNLISLDEKQGLAKYGDKAKHGALEINKL